MRGRLTVVLALVALLSGAAIAQSAGKKPKPGKWTGTVGPYQLSFKVSKDRKRVIKFVTNWDGATFCGFPIGVQVHERFPPRKIRKGGVHDKVKKKNGTGPKTRFNLSIHFTSSTTATGKISAVYRIRNDALPPCHASSAFSAKHK